MKTGIRKAALFCLIGLISMPVQAQFSPDDIAGLDLWLSADYGVYTNSGGVVTTWVDRVSSIPFQNSTASPTQPTVVTNWQNQAPALRFPAHVSGGLQCAANSLSITNKQGRTLFLVLNVLPHTGGSGEVFGSATSAMVDFGNWTHANRIRLRHNDSLLSAADSVSWGQTHIVTVRGKDNGDLDAYLNGDSPLLSATGEEQFQYFFYPLNNVQVGVGWARYNGRTYRGDLAELLLFDHGLSDSDMEDVVNWLADSYDIDVSFDNALPIPVVDNREHLARIRPDEADLAGELLEGVQADVSVVWGTNANLAPGTGGNGTNTIQKVSLGLVQFTVTNLVPETTYYWRYYATNSGGEAWAPVAQSFRTPAEIPVPPPPVTSGLVLHMQAGNVSYTNNAVVTWWPDSSGHCAPFVRDWGSLNPPRYHASVPELNGRPAMWFWSSVPFRSQIPGMIAGKDRTLILAVIPSIQTGVNEVFGLGTDTSVNLDTQRIRIRNAGNLYTPDSSLPVEPHIVVISDGQDQTPHTQVWIDGVAQTLTYQDGYDATTRYFSSALNVSAYVGGTGFGAVRSYRGYLAEVLLFDRLLDEKEHLRVGFYLKNSYGIEADYNIPQGTLFMFR